MIFTWLFETILDILDIFFSFLPTIPDLPVVISENITKFFDLIFENRSIRKAARIDSTQPFLIGDFF